MKPILWASIVLCLLSCAGAVLSVVFMQPMVFLLCAAAALLSGENACCAFMWEKSTAK